MPIMLSGNVFPGSHGAYNSAPVIFSTTIPSTENPLSQGSKYVHGLADGIDFQNVQSVGGAPGYAIATAFNPTNYDDSICHLKPSVGISSTRHSVKATVRRVAGYAPSNGHEIEFLVGLTISANSNIGYEVLFTVGAGSQIARQNGARGAFVLHGTGNWLDTLNGATFGDVLNGDVIELQYAIIAGSPNLRCLLNGVYKWDVNDTSVSKIMSGQPGLGFFCRGGGAVPGVLDSYGWSGPITFATI